MTQKKEYNDFFTTSVQQPEEREKTPVSVSKENNQGINAVKAQPIPQTLENSTESLNLTKETSLSLTIEENSLRSKLKDAEFRLMHEITQINQLHFNIDYLSSFFKRNSQTLEEDNRICQNMIGYLGQEIEALKKIVDSAEKKIESFEEKRKNSRKKH